MLRSSLFAFLAPAMVSAMAFPWAGPEPTLMAAMAEHDILGRSPAPTKAPELGLKELFQLAKRAGDNTCGYISGVESLSTPASGASTHGLFIRLQLLR
jgi:hypothetical protein